MPNAAPTVPVDAAGRVTLPPEFAGSVVTVERVGASEVRIRLADDFPESRPVILSEADARVVAGLIESPPEPTDALRALLAKRPT